MLHRITSLIAALDIGEPNIPRVEPGPGTVQTVLQIITAISAGVALLVISIGAFKLVISRGNPEALNRARDTIIYAVAGLIISAAAFLIVTFVVEQI